MEILVRSKALDLSQNDGQILKLSQSDRQFGGKTADQFKHMKNIQTKKSNLTKRINKPRNYYSIQSICKKYDG